MTVKTRTQEWWKHAVVYQIYPASFCDSNGDGVGDLVGITSKLDYIHSLGANVIWICPMYDSPQVDMGYDISNYEDVYRPYGTLQDMEHLIKETHARGMRIMLDLVINHTSDEHAWFKESKSSKDSDKRDWYIWQPAKYASDGTRLPPNNWRCNFGGGSAWEWDEATQEYYLHLFCKEQPDLNWENPITRKAIYDSSMEFWLKRGVDGFRVDTVNMYSKPPGLPDAPIVDPAAEYQPAGMVYCNGPRMHEFLGEMNDILTKYDAITVGELPCTPDTAKVLKYVSAEAKQLNMVFQFDVVDVGFGRTHKYETTPKNYTLPQLKDAIDRTQSLIRGTDAWTTVFMENHDQARSVSRFGSDSPAYRVRSAKMLSMLQCCLSGTQYVYQGQEIGIVNAPKSSYPVENYLDVDSYLFMDMVKARHGADNAEELDKAFTALAHYARDHARIPIPWSSKGKNAGFSQIAEKDGKTIEESWMKPHPLAGEINVASQVDDPSSVLSFWKEMLKFRQANATHLVYGDYEALRRDDENVHYFVKVAQGVDPQVLVVLNFTAEEQKWEVPNPREGGLPSTSPLKLKLLKSTQDGASEETLLAPYEGRVFLVS
ncbi:alpha amylase, catalytic domain-containing protein [Sarocladium implicatum]|nr:alpha amylase, catalytic domain-containing protein [Sarocladium implicatum]